MSSTSFLRAGAPLLCKLLAIYCLLVGVSSILVALSGSPLHVPLSAIAFSAAYGLWLRRLWALPISLLLFGIELTRTAVDVVTGDTSAVIPLVLTLLIVVFLLGNRESFE